MDQIEVALSWDCHVFMINIKLISSVMYSLLAEIVT